jgi:uncharacterized SAM-binding protein YcdF (DUF218 family)
MNEQLISLTYLGAALLVPPTSLILLGLVGLLFVDQRRRLARLLTSGSLLGLLVLSLPAVSFTLMRQIEVSPLPHSRAVGDAQAIVILAGGVARGAPEWGGETVNLFTLQRLRYGAWLAKETNLPVLVTGAAPRVNEAGEAELMRTLLQNEYGVRVRWVDDRSTTTATSATETARLLKPAGVRKVALVTSALHVHRASAVFERAGLQVVPAPTGYFGWRGDFEWTHLVPNGDALRTSYLALREMLAIAFYRVRHTD